MDNKKRFLKKELQDIIEEIGLSKNDKELKKSADKFNEAYERYASFHKTATLDGARWVRVEDFKNGFYTCFDQHGGEYKATKSQLDWN
jgi:hypothetical protein